MKLSLINKNKIMKQVLNIYLTAGFPGSPVRSFNDACKSTARRTQTVSIYYKNN